MTMSAASGYRIDPHVKILDAAVVRRAKAVGLDAIVYAPHFTRVGAIRERARQYTDEDLLVVPGRELFTGSWRNRKHVLALGLQEPLPDFLTLEGTMGALADREAAVMAPHPGFLTVSLDRSDLRRYAGRIDAVEVYNPKHRGWHNRRARALRADVGAPAFASSYAHLRPTVGAAWVEFEESLDSNAAVVEAFRSEAPRTIGHERGLRHAAVGTLEFAHLGWENTWKKVARVGRPGRSPTHPAHPAYGGAFEAESVY